MNMTCERCGREVILSVHNYYDAKDDSLHYDGVAKLYTCIEKYEPLESYITKILKEGK